MAFYREGAASATSAFKEIQIMYATPTAVGNTLLGVAKITPTLTPGPVAANTTAEQTFTVPGVVLGDFVQCSPPGLTPGVGIFGARVTAANIVAVQFINATTGALTPPAGLHTFFVIR